MELLACRGAHDERKDEQCLSCVVPSLSGHRHGIYRAAGLHHGHLGPKYLC
jgi:hypothetical protein